MKQHRRRPLPTGLTQGFVCTDSCACTRFLCTHEILVHAQHSCAYWPAWRSAWHSAWRSSLCMQGARCLRDEVSSISRHSLTHNGCVRLHTRAIGNNRQDHRPYNKQYNRQYKWQFNCNTIVPQTGLSGGVLAAFLRYGWNDCGGPGWKVPPRFCCYVRYLVTPTFKNTS